MASGTHISIPQKYDLLLNQELLLLSEIKKFSKNELIKSIYFANFDYTFHDIKKFSPFPKFSPITKDSYYNAINKRIHHNVGYRDKKAFDIASLGLKQCEELANEINDCYNKMYERIIFKYLSQEQKEVFNYFANHQVDIPEINSTSRLYIRCEPKTINKDELIQKLAIYFKMPLYIRERYLFINNPIIANLFEEANNPKITRKVFLLQKSSMIPNHSHTCFKIEENGKFSYVDLCNNKITKTRKTKQQKTFITKEIKITNTDLFYECLKYFVNIVFVVSHTNDSYTVYGNEKDIYYLEKMLL